MDFRPNVEKREGVWCYTGKTVSVVHRVAGAACRALGVPTEQTKNRDKVISAITADVEGALDEAARPKLRVIAFDCFGTLFDIGNVPKEQRRAYVDHVNSENFSEFDFGPEWYCAKAHPDVPRGIAGLVEKGYLPVAMSNGSVPLLRHLSQQAGFEFFDIMDFVGFGVYKPKPKAYTIVRATLGFLPAETLMVTANPTFGDLEGAAALSMPSAVIRHSSGIAADVLALAGMLPEVCIL